MIYKIYLSLLTIIVLSTMVNYALADHECLKSDETEKFSMVFIEGGNFLFGSNHAYPEEAKEHLINMDGFWIGLHEVTNKEFNYFVEATGYTTVAEIYLDKKNTQIFQINREYRAP